MGTRTAVKRAVMKPLTEDCKRNVFFKNLLKRNIRERVRTGPMWVRV
jgi:hypothetical protein